MKTDGRFRRLAVLGGVAALGAVTIYILAGGSSKLSPPPAPGKEGKMSLEETLAKRRSTRRFRNEALTRRQIARLCWAAQGISDAETGFRTCPSAGALYPLELYVVTAEGVEHYVPKSRAMEKHLKDDLRKKLQTAALDQSSVGRAPATFIIAGVVSRTAGKYGRRARRYVLMEAGHAGQNLLLQATALGLAGVPVGAFTDEEVAKVLSLPDGHAPLYLIPVGLPAKPG